MPVAKPKLQKVEPLWKGPERDGVTFSLLAKYLVCKERFRLLAMEGLKEPEGWNHRLEFGSMWHVCEEAHAAGSTWLAELQSYCRKLATRWKESANQVDQWYNIVKLQFPIYVDYWRKHPDVKKRRPICQELPFEIPYKLPSGRVVILRGKFDSVDEIDKAIYIQENKGKGDPNEQQILRQLTFDLQTMIYAVAAETNFCESVKFGGVRYNVVRRPLSGGKHSITQHKGRKTKKGLVGMESTEQFYNRLAGLIRDNASFFFMRWRIEVSPIDLVIFKKTCLNPILENLCDDYEWWDCCYRTGSDVYLDTSRAVNFGYHFPRHFRFPYGCYNQLTEGRSTAYDDYFATGSTRELERVPTLFPELQ